MSESARFSAPLSAGRPRGARLIEGFSPKLRRRVRCFGRHAFDQWIRLEADPAALRFCERPLAFGEGENTRIADFWVGSRNGETLLVIGEDCPMREVSIGGASLPIRSVPIAELAAARQWIANWERMLPYIVACRTCLSDAVIQAVAAFVTAPMPLTQIERYFASSDPTLVRGAVFSLLHRGRLRAPQLHTHPLSLLTTFEPAGEGE
jgi:hypothetical protein